jgi:hypothetical protein
MSFLNFCISKSMRKLRSVLNTYLNDEQNEKIHFIREKRMCKRVIYNFVKLEEGFGGAKTAERRTFKHRLKRFMGKL